MDNFDFCGWATKANLMCSDGRIIRKDAFKHNDGQTVPLVWNHQHNDPDEVLGHALLENRDEGVYAYCKFNETESGKTARLLVQHGDVNALSIYANQLKQQGPNVMHGNIRELSLVLAGANPGASIESVIMHGEESDEEAVIFTGEEISLFHAAESDAEQKGKKEMANETKKPDEGSKKPEGKEDKTVADVFNELTEEQKTVVYAMIGQALEDAGVSDEDESEEGEKDMKHNVFEHDVREESGTLCHADQESIIAMAKSSQVGSFQTALQIYADENNLQHDAVSSGFVQSGSGNVTTLFPEYKEVRPGAPELITNDQGWISVVMSKVHKSPISRIRTSQVDIRNIDTIRAKGYKKGKSQLRVVGGVFIQH